jgi:hypothetical protein
MPRIVTILLLVGGLAAGNRYAPGVIQAVLALTVLYLAVTHADKLGRRVHQCVGRPGAGVRHHPSELDERTLTRC